MNHKIISLLIFLMITLNNLHLLEAQTWIKSAAYDSSGNLPASSINSALYTHLYYAFARINSSTYQLSFSDESSASTFSSEVKLNNPSILTLLSIGLAYGNYFTFSSMVSQASYRNSFIISSIKTARLYGFHGLDLCWLWPNTSSDMKNIGILLDEWRAAINSESRNSSNNQPPLILTMAVYRHPDVGAASFPVDSIRRNLDWANFMGFDYNLPLKENVTGNHAALYDPSSSISTDFGITAWIERGLPESKLVLGIPYHGYGWRLVNPNDNSVGAPASGPYPTLDGSMGYKAIKSFMLDYGHGASSSYNSTYVVNYCIIRSTWINFDDVEAIRTKILYAKAKGLRGYSAFQLGNDDNWKLSQMAYEVGEDHGKKKQLWMKIFVPIAMVILLFFLGFVAYYVRCKMLKSKGKINFDMVASSKLGPNTEGNELHQEQNTSDLQVFTFSELRAATSIFSCQNRIGEGGYGPVYKGKLARGQEVAVKRLSKTSNQGHKEFKNEVKLTARLQHVNVLRLLGFCTEREEKMLIYEYMPNRSLDYYLFDPKRRSELNWEQRVGIIEGIVQGLLYLQEYSNFIIIHRDIKASNILLDNNMRPKISDFGMARIFHKKDIEANTRQIVGTYGYVPPEYVKRGAYSTKYDVYSFGVLLLQIISGKKNTCFYGWSEDLHLLEYAFELWRSDHGMEFIDPTLDDSFSSCKLLRCLQVALLCVQESSMDRPSILQVYSMLITENVPIACPNRPAFSRSEDQENGSTLDQEICSVNSVSISQMLPR